MTLEMKLGHIVIYGEKLDRMTALALIAAPVVSWWVWVFLGG